MSIQWIIIVIVLMIVEFPAEATIPPPTTAQFCVLPVDTSIADSAPIAAHRNLDFRIQVPGMPSPIFGYQESAYAIGQDLKLHPYLAPFPQPDILFGLSLSWVNDPDHGRILGIEAYAPYTALEMRKGETAFHILYQDHETRPKAIYPPDSHYLNFIGVYKKQRKVIIAAFDNLKEFTVDQDALVSWPDAKTLFNNDVNGLISLGYDKQLATTFIIDGNLSLHIWTDSGEWVNLGDGAQPFEYIVDLPNVGAAGVEPDRIGKNQLKDVVLYDPKSALNQYTRLIDEKGWFGSFEFSHVTEMFAQILRYNSSFPLFVAGHWQVLTSQGYRDVPGGATGLDPSIYAFPKDLSVLHRSIIEGANFWYFYNGKSMAPIPGSDTDTIGANVYVRDFDGSEIYNLPTIGHVLVSRPTGVFEITGQGKMVPVPQLKGMWNFTEWPEAHVVLAVAPQGLAIIGADLNPVFPALKFWPVAPASDFGLPITQANYVPLHALVGTNWPLDEQNPELPLNMILVNFRFWLTQFWRLLVHVHVNLQASLNLLRFSRQYAPNKKSASSG